MKRSTGMILEVTNEAFTVLMVESLLSYKWERRREEDLDWRKGDFVIVACNEKGELKLEEFSEDAPEARKVVNATSLFKQKEAALTINLENAIKDCLSKVEGDEAELYGAALRLKRASLSAERFYVQRVRWQMYGKKTTLQVLNFLFALNDESSELAEDT